MSMEWIGDFDATECRRRASSDRHSTFTTDFVVVVKIRREIPHDRNL
jgi:hypothetical protein